MAHTQIEASAEPSAAKADVLARLVAQARRMFPVLRERATQAGRMRQLPRETIKEFIAAGFFRLFQPACFGGYELDYGFPQLYLCGEIGRACGSSAWVLSVINVHHCQVGMFAIEAQEDVWGHSPDALVCSAFVPDKSQFEPVAGGYRLSGRWKFSSGVQFATWVMLGAPLSRGSNPPEMIWCLVPTRELRIIDTWHSIGLRATGSNDIEISGAFVPAYRTLPLRVLMEGDGPGAAAHRSHIYRIPAFSNSTLISCATGIARGALEGFTGRLCEQPQTGRPRAADDEAVQLEVAQAAARIDCAVALLARDAEEYNAVVRGGAKLSPEQCARFLRNPAFVGQLLMQTADSLQNLSGAHGLADDDPVARAFLDIRAIMSHIGLRWHLAARSWGQVMMGLVAPNPHG